MKRPAVLVVALVLLGLFYGGFRLLRSATSSAPAVVVRNTDAHRMLSNDIGSRVQRLLRARAPAPAPATRLIALTFDDGPYPVETPLLLDVLADLHVPATFFLIGHDTDQFPGLARRIEAAGHEIANHTQTHPANFDTLDPAQVSRELGDGARTLERYVRDPAIRTLMRPPHGRFTLRTVETAQHDGYHVILWNDDPGDWRSVTPEVLDEHIAANASAPEIVLLHSGRLNTIEALPTIVARFRAAGFAFVTVGQLMSHVSASTIVHPLKLRV